VAAHRDAGATDGLGKFDLSRWNEPYFRRLSDYLGEAGKHGVVIELVLFCPFYEDNMWNVSPLNARNNVNGVGQDVARTDVYTLKHADLTRVQEALTRKLVETIASFDNVYLEICNEPYFGGVTLDWQRHIADTITDAQRARSAKHLVAQNIANGSARIENPHPAVSLFNFHYASPPDAVRVNYGLNKPIAFDETGFAGTEDVTYRRQAWEFLLAGGAVFSHLDYSFTADGHESGTFAYPKTQPGGGGAVLRAQLGHLKRMFDSLPFVQMRPDDAVLAAAGLPAGVSACALSNPGTHYAVYLNGSGATRLSLALPGGRYEARWWDTRTGPAQKRVTLSQDDNNRSLVLDVPPYTEDIALRLVRHQTR
jgi:hypothetical protein